MPFIDFLAFWTKKSCFLGLRQLVIPKVNIRYRCHIEQCDIDNQTVNTEWLSYAIPNQESSNTFLSELQTYDSCRRFQRIDEGTVNNFAYFSISYKVLLQTT